MEVQRQRRGGEACSAADQRNRHRATPVAKRCRDCRGRRQVLGPNPDKHQVEEPSSMMSAGAFEAKKSVEDAKAWGRKSVEDAKAVVEQVYRGLN